MNTHIFNTQIELENEKARLIPLENPKSRELKEIIFNDEIWMYMGVSMGTQSDFEAYLSNAINEKNKGISYPFLVIDKQSKRVAGSTRFGYLNIPSQKCEIGWTWYGKEFQGTGLNKACKHLLLSFGFENIGFRRIQFSADQENIRSQKAIEKLGATKEGLFRNNYIDAHGKSKNDVYYSIIKEEWDAINNQLFAEF